MQNEEILLEVIFTHTVSQISIKGEAPDCQLLFLITGLLDFRIWEYQTAAFLPGTNICLRARMSKLLQ
jgi:hypothetical protein